MKTSRLQQTDSVPVRLTKGDQVDPNWTDSLKPTEMPSAICMAMICFLTHRILST